MNNLKSLIRHSLKNCAGEDLIKREQTRKKKNSAYQAYNFTCLLVKDCEIIDDTTKVNTKTNGLKSKAQGNNDAVNIFLDHVWFRHRGSMRFYDPSYGKSFNKTGSTLGNYCETLLSGLCFNRRLKSGESLLPGEKLVNLFIRHYKRYMVKNELLKTLMNTPGKSENMDVYFHTTKGDI